MHCELTLILRNIQGRNNRWGQRALALPRKRVRKQHADETSRDDLSELNDRDSFRVATFLPIIDALEQNIRKRAAVYKSISDKFSFLVHLDASAEQIETYVRKLMLVYPEDIDENLINELRHFFSMYERVMIRNSMATKSFTV